jgi:hypothetical protein
VITQGSLGDEISAFRFRDSSLILMPVNSEAKFGRRQQVKRTTIVGGKPRRFGINLKNGRLERRNDLARYQTGMR